MSALSTARRVLMVVLAALVAIALAAPASAQSTGMVKGKVLDEKQQPIEGARVVVEFKEGITRKHEVKTNKKGEFIQIGLPPGQYTVTAEVPKLGSQSFDVRVRLGDASEVNFVLAPGLTVPTKEDAAKSEALKKIFDEGVAASRAGNDDEALAKFNEAAALVPGCFDCYYNIGYAYSQKKDYENAEKSFKQALELKADYVEAYNGLATIYNAQRRFDEAKAASAKAAELSAGAGAGVAGGGTATADAVYNQGVIAWNAGQIDDARQRFEEALKINPNHADSHYQLGMALVNQGKLDEAVVHFEEYLRIAPDGQYAAQAKGILGSVKK